MNENTNTRQPIDAPPVGVRAVGSTVELDFTLYLSDGNPISNELFAESLIGLEKLLRNSSGAVYRFLGLENELKKCKNSVALGQVRQGSKLEDFVFQIFLGDDAQASAIAQSIHNLMLDHPTAFYLALAGILAYAAVRAVKIYTDSKKKQNTVEAHNSVVVQIGDVYGLDPALVRDILEKGVSSKASTAKAVAQVLAPAKQRGGTKVKLGGEDGIEIPEVIVEETPLPEEIHEEPETSAEDFKRVKLNFVAMDRDRKERGWAVEMPKGFPGEGRRLPAKLEETVNSTELRYAQDAEVDISVVKDSNGNPKSVLIRKLHKPDSKK